MVPVIKPVAGFPLAASRQCRIIDGWFWVGSEYPFNPLWYQIGGDGLKDEIERVTSLTNDEDQKLASFQGGKIREPSFIFFDQIKRIYLA